jgi:ABC-2 type transport system permease protein
VTNRLRFFIRASAFLRKEIVEILRQPRLILTLVLGPFLILLLFGIGFGNKDRSFRTLFVVPEDSEIKQQIEEYATTLGPQLDYAGMTPDESTARAKLRTGEVDIMVITPTHITATISANQSPVFEIFHNRIDPLDDSFIRFTGRIYVNEVNRRILRRITGEGQRQAATAAESLSNMRDRVEALRQAFNQGDTTAVRTHLQALDQALNTWALTADMLLPILSGIQQATGISLGKSPQEVVRLLQGSMDTLTTMMVQINDLTDQDFSRFEAQLTEIQSKLQTFQELDPGVLVNVFEVETRQLTGRMLSFSQFYTPAVIVLLLQHLCVTFGGLSIVREGWTGTMELFKVSPLSSLEILLGKYASFMIFAGLLGAVTTALVVYALGVPMLGSWLGYAVVLLALIFSALGMGFVISLFSDTVSQAVQYAMILLLASVFFTGFFQDLALFHPAVRTISWLIPATYAIRLLQDVMLRGVFSPLGWLFILVAIGIGFFVIAWLILRWRLLAE